MSLHHWAQQLVFGNTLADKLVAPTDLSDAPFPAVGVPETPGRPAAWAFSDERLAFPSKGALRDAHARGRMLHFFANHELLAIELLALGLLRFPDTPRGFRRGLVQTIREEQRHLQLYLDRMAALGVTPGTVPVNRFFWDCVADAPQPIDLCARMGMTFEQANLDWCLHYGAVLRDVGDDETAAILDVVLADEIGHVRHGLHWFRRWKAQDESDWDAWVRRLALPLSPSRAKGARVDRAVRAQVGFDDDFVDRLEVAARSKGRPPDVWLFNPDCEAELADPKHVASPAVAALEHDLAALPWVLARPEDLVLVPTAPRVPWLQHLRSAGMRLPELDIEVGTRKVGRMQPWGWSPRSAARLGVPFTGDAAPFRKDLAARLLAAWKPQLAWLAGTSCTTWDQVAAAAAALETRGLDPAVKSVLSTAGQGILRRVTQADVERLLLHQPVVLVVPWLQRDADLSVHLDLTPEGAVYRGSTVFETTPGGSWRRTQASRFSLPPDLLRFLHGQHPRGLPGLARDLGAVLHEHLDHLGPVGVDMLVGRDAEGQRVLHPLVELNPRWTMGRVALALRPHVHPSATAWLGLERRPEAALSPVQRVDGRLRQGRLWLTDPERSRIAAFLDIC